MKRRVLADMDGDRGIEKVEIWERAAISHTGVHSARKK